MRFGQMLVDLVRAGNLGDAPKRAKWRLIRDAVSYTFEVNGAGGIRTPVDPEAEPDFESGAFNRSATAPVEKLSVTIDPATAPERLSGGVFGADALWMSTTGYGARIAK